MAGVVTGAPTAGPATVYGYTPAPAVTGRPSADLGHLGPPARDCWPFLINWDRGATETVEFRTEIITSRSGREQRRALRSVPRWKYDFSGWEKGDGYRKLNNLLRKRGGQPWAFQHPADWITLSADAAAGDSTISTDVTPTWLQEGVCVILEWGRNQRELVRVRVVLLGALVIDAALVNNIPAGAKIRRAMYGVLGAPFSQSMVTTDVSEYSITFNANPDGVFTMPDGEPFATYDDYEVFSMRPNFAKDIQFDFDPQYEQIDYGMGRVETFLPKNTSIDTRKFTYLGKTKAEAQSLIQFFCRQKGQRGEFLVPTWGHDLKPSVIGINTVNFDDETAKLLQENPLYGYVFFMMANGNSIVNKIVGVSSNTISFQDNMTFPSPVVFISLMARCRFATDALAVDWRTGTVAEIVFTFRAVEQGD